MKKRDRFEIAADILRVAEGGALRTRIVYGANLNFTMVKGYLERLLGAGRLRREGPLYYTTEKGRAFIGHVDAINESSGARSG